jgi:hypothetical protein
MMPVSIQDAIKTSKYALPYNMAVAPTDINTPLLNNEVKPIEYPQTELRMPSETESRYWDRPQGAFPHEEPPTTREKIESVPLLGSMLTETYDQAKALIMPRSMPEEERTQAVMSVPAMLAMGKLTEMGMPIMRGGLNKMTQGTVLGEKVTAQDIIAPIKNEYGYIKPGYRTKIENNLKNNKYNLTDAEYQREALELQNMLEQHPDKLNYNPKKGFIEKNVEYMKSVDPDLLCQRSVGCDMAVNRLKTILGEEYDSKYAWDVLSQANKEGLQTPCPQCYVYSGRVKSGNAMQKPFVEGVGGYNGEIKRLNENLVAEFKKRPLRFFSSTDAKPEHIPGLMELIYDAAEKGLPGGAYTKNPELAEILAPSNLKINLSIGPNEKIGMNMAKALELRRKYPNIGTTYIALNDEQVAAALANPEIDHVIPWHRSGMGQNYVEDIFGMEAKDFTAYQSERAAGMSLKQSRAKGLTIKDYEHMGNKEKYLKLCKKKGLTPKFEQFVNDPNYMKLIGMEYGKFGDPNPLAPVVAKFDMPKARAAIARWQQEPKKDYSQYLKIADDIINRVKKPKSYGSKMYGKHNEDAVIDAYNRNIRIQ